MIPAASDGNGPAQADKPSATMRTMENLALSAMRARADTAPPFNASGGKIPQKEPVFATLPCGESC